MSKQVTITVEGENFAISTNGLKMGAAEALSIMLVATVKGLRAIADEEVSNDRIADDIRFAAMEILEGGETYVG